LTISATMTSHLPTSIEFLIRTKKTFCQSQCLVLLTTKSQYVEYF
jgi:hypothetical protein